MSYAFEWIPGVVVLWTVLLLLVVPEFAVIAVLALAFLALVALVALAAAALVSPYLLVRSLRRRLAQPTTRRRRRWIASPSAIPTALTADRRYPAPSTDGNLRSGRTARVARNPRRT